MGRSTATVPKPSPDRLRASLSESPFDLANKKIPPLDQGHTVLYLAYGSNLANETFRGKRGIRPLSQINVQVPSLRLTFDLPGVPYLEPCFANSGLRDEERLVEQDGEVDEKTPLTRGSADTTEYRKDRWHKGMVGVVYEVTAKDYAHIIATEGGGSSYKDVLVDCYPFENDDPKTPVPQHPKTTAFKAHTLFAPATAPGTPPPKNSGRLQRPDTHYAQPSARYLKLITDGAAETRLPYEYQEYLHAIRHYQVTTWRQRAGQAIFLTFWIPIIFALFAFGRLFSDKKTGQAPAWLSYITGLMFRSVWSTYDMGFKKMFGDGERTVGDDPDGLVNETHGGHAIDMEKSYSDSRH